MTKQKFDFLLPKKSTKDTAKKGQIIGQVVIMVMSVIVFSMVLLYGYKSIKSIESTRSQVEIVQFGENLKAGIKRIAQDYGSVKKLDLQVPIAYKEVCFVDLSKVKAPGYEWSSLTTKSALIADAVKSASEKEGQNVFTIPLSDTPIKVERIAVANIPLKCPRGFIPPVAPSTDPTDDPFDKGWICIPTPTGKLSLRLEGLGDRTCVREWK